MITSSVDSGHPSKDSHEIPHESLSGWGNLSGKIISIKRNHYSNLRFFCKCGFPFSYMLQLFQNSFIYGEATSSHFFRVTTSTQQLLFRSSYFFIAAAFWGAPFSEQSLLSKQFFFFRIATFSEINLQRVGTFWEKEVLQSSYFLEQLPFLA